MTIDNALVKKLKFVEGSYWYLETMNNHLYSKVIHKVSKDAIDKIVARLKGGSQSISTNDRVYILDGYNSKQSDLKEYIRQAGARITNNITKATVILSNNTIGNTNTYQSTCNYIIESNGVNLHFNVTEEIDSFNQAVYRKSDILISDLDISSGLFYSEDVSDNYSYSIKNNNYNNRCDNSYCFLTSEGLVILYNLLQNKLKVINENDFLNNCATFYINEENYYTIRNMLRGQPDDQSTAASLIFTCDINKSFYYLWKLIKEDGWRLNRFKKLKLYQSFEKRACEISDFQCMTVLRFIGECIKRKVLTDDVKNIIIKELNDEIQYDLDRISDKYYNGVDINFKVDFQKIEAYVNAEDN